VIEDADELDIYSVYWDMECWCRRTVGPIDVWLPKELTWPNENPDDPGWQEQQINGKTLEMSFAQMLGVLHLIDEGYDLTFGPDEWLSLLGICLLEKQNHFELSGVHCPKDYEELGLYPLVRYPVVALNRDDKWALTLFGPVRLGKPDGPDEPEGTDPEPDGRGP
jgi:hypothetical protein